MTVLTDDTVNVATETEEVVTDRRRPGRMQSVSAELIPILRNQTPDIVIDFDDDEQGAAIRGLFYAVILSVPLWIGLIYLASFVLSF